MSIDSALQRVAELNALTGQAQLAAGRAPAPAPEQGAFPAVLAAAQQPHAAGDATLVPTVPGSAPRLSAASAGSHLPVLLGGAMPGVGLAGGIGMASPVGQTMIALAQQEIGVTESPPGSNDGARIAQYRTATAGAAERPGPWCSYFVSWLAQQAGAPVGEAGSGLGYVPALEQWARSTGRWLDGPATQGDLVVFDRSGRGGLPDHVGIVERIDPDGTVHTIEGNTSNSVARRTYPAGDAKVKGFVRLG